MKKITIAIVDDHILMRELWTTMFADETEMEVTGESGNLIEAIEMIKLKKPNIVLLDINLGQESGFDGVVKIIQISPRTRIIAISMHNQAIYAKKMLQLGAKAYVTKNSSRDELFKAIKEVMKGKVYVCAEIRGILPKQIVKRKSGQPKIKELTLPKIEVG